MFGQNMKNTIMMLCLISSFVFCYSCSSLCQINNCKDKKPFNYSKYVLSEVPTMYVNVKSVDKTTGNVVIRGGNSRKPTTLFLWNWGDGSVTKGSFPQEHIYTDRTQNYIVKVKACYPDSSSETVEAFVRFVSLELKPVPLSNKITVTIPNSKVELGSRLPQEGMYKFSETLSFFPDEFFTEISREMIEYILGVAASIQMDFVNSDVYMANDTFQQVLLRDAGFGGMYSLWYTNPVSFGVGDYGFQGSIQWSSFFHEMGHNFTLNTPADYYFGGKSDGNANAIYSEAMAQIFAHATSYCLVNDYKKFGISSDLAYEIQLSAENSFQGLARCYKKYIDSGCPFSSWNDPNADGDETFPTFMTVAYKFFEYAEKGNYDYRESVKRMLTFLQHFDKDWHSRYDPENNSVEGATFRATMMVCALSSAFETDLRADFRKINFPIDDTIYTDLMLSAKQ